MRAGHDARICARMLRLRGAGCGGSKAADAVVTDTVVANPVVKTTDVDLKMHSTGGGSKASSPASAADNATKSPPPATLASAPAAPAAPVAPVALPNPMAANAAAVQLAMQKRLARRKSEGDEQAVESVAAARDGDEPDFSVLTRAKGAQGRRPRSVAGRRSAQSS